MTRIEFSEKNEKIVGFCIKGHTQTASYGNDIVCASISATSLMTLNGLLEVLMLSELKYEIKDGFMSCDLFELNSNDIDKAQILLKSLEIILEQIAKENPKNVQFRIRRYEK